MYRYLSTKTPDYTTETLNITPHTIMNITGYRPQIMYKFNDGKPKVLSISDDQSVFLIGLQWELLTASEYDSIMDLWHNEDKANFMERTFPWISPIDDRRYTARFMSELFFEDIIGPDRKLYNIQLRIEGNYPI